MDKIILKEESTIQDNYDDKIKIIMSQTIYDYDESLLKLKQHNFNHINVIKDYMGITEKKAPTRILSVNQEIYKQIRKQLDISEYNKKHPLNLEHIQKNIEQEEEKKN